MSSWRDELLKTDVLNLRRICCQLMAYSTILIVWKDIQVEMMFACLFAKENPSDQDRSTTDYWSTLIQAGVEQKPLFKTSSGILELID